MNILYDTPRQQLAKSGHLLRLRLERPLGVGRPSSFLTYKGPTLGSVRAGPRRAGQGEARYLKYKPRAPSQSKRYKVREEVEVPVVDPEGLGAILEGIGLRPAFRYEKRRATFRLTSIPGLVVDLDETPIGVFVELEGRGGVIDRVAKLLGYGRVDYIIESYRALYLTHCRRRNALAGDMLFTLRKK